MCHVSQNLANCCITARTSCIQQIDSKSKWWSYSIMVHWQCIQPHRCEHHKCSQPSQPSTSFVSALSICHNKRTKKRLLFLAAKGWIKSTAKLWNPEFTMKFQKKVPLFFRYPHFFIIQYRIDGRKPPCKNELDPSSRFDTIADCDRHTDGRTWTDTQQQDTPS